MNLADTLFTIEKFLNLELDSLLPFAEMDDVGGFHPDPAQSQWHIGSIFAVEGQTLYALVRALKPQTIVEIGSGLGCSATHIASAMQANCKEHFKNCNAHLTTVDRGNTPQIPDNLKMFVEIINGDAINYLAMLEDGSVDMIFEDADHTEALCAAIGELAKKKLAPGGLLVSHDAAHFAVGRDIVAGYDKVGLDHRVYLTEPSDCGLLLWRKPGVQFKQPDQSDVRFGSMGAPWQDTEIAVDPRPWMTEPVLQAQEDEPPAESGQASVTEDMMDKHAKWNDMLKLAALDTLTDETDKSHPQGVVEPPAKKRTVRKSKKVKGS